uniref:Uncharacterized protein n=1 Tax=Opuntia streptacantha TaxID=393608 RepID=A0A7C8ZQ99_OPUST
MIAPFYVVGGISCTLFLSLLDSFLGRKDYTAKICWQPCKYVFISYLLRFNILSAFFFLFWISVLAKCCFSLFVYVVELGGLIGFVLSCDYLPVLVLGVFQLGRVWPILGNYKSL